MIIIFEMNWTNGRKKREDVKTFVGRNLVTQTCLFKHRTHLNKAFSREVGAFCHDSTGLCSGWASLGIMLPQTNKAACRVSVPGELQEGNESPSLGGRINTYLSEDRSLIGTGLLMSFLVPRVCILYESQYFSAHVEPEDVSWPPWSCQLPQRKSREVSFFS